MTPTHDLVVGILAVIVGGLLLGGAAANSVHLMQLAKSRLLAEAIGQRAARIVIACLGLAVILLGLVIAVGWRVKW
jgi:hypothetical protein